MIHHVAATEAFNDLYQLKFESWSQFVQSDSNTCVFLFVLIVVRQDDLRAWKIVNLTLRAIGPDVGLVHSLVTKHEVRHIIEFSQIRHFLIVHQLFDSSVNSPLPRADSIVPKFDNIFTVLGLRQIK